MQKAWLTRVFLGPDENCFVLFWFSPCVNKVLFLLLLLLAQGLTTEYLGGQAVKSTQFYLVKKYSPPVLPCVTIGRERITASTLLKQFSSIFLLDGKLQLRYSGRPPVDGCGKEKNSKVVFYFECGNSVGQPEFQR